MWSLFVAENVHFAVYLTGALALVAAGWLYVDVWLVYRRARDLPAVLGWTALTLAFLIGATEVEFSGFAASVFASVVYTWVLPFLKLSGYGLIALALLIDPLQAKPVTRGWRALPVGFGWLGTAAGWLVPLLVPLLALLAALAYLRRATQGLERHVRPAVGVFVLFALYEGLFLVHRLRETTHPSLYRFAAPFGVAWWLEHGVLLAASVCLLLWVGGYLLRRLRTQLVVALAGMTLSGFLITTVTFTGLLLWNVQEAALERLAADARTIGYSFNIKEAALRSDAELLAQDVRLAGLLQTPNTEQLTALLQEALLRKELDSLVITDADGRVVLRGEDPERAGDSLSDNLLIRQALEGTVVSGFTSGSGSLAPVVGVAAAAPVRQGDRVIGVVYTGIVLDSAFLDGFKEVTSLEVAFYSEGLLSASTIGADSTGSRWIGTKDTNERLSTQAVTGVVSGTARVLSIPYLAAYLPLHDQAGTRVAVLFVGAPQVEVLRAAGRAVQLTFLVATLLMVLSFIPASLLAQRITRQVR